MKSHTALLFLCVLCTPIALLAEDWKTDWGSLSTTDRPGIHQAVVAEAQGKERILIPAQLGQITRASTSIDGIRHFLDIQIDSAKSQTFVILPRHPRPQAQLTLTLETGEDTDQSAFGLIQLSAKDCDVRGKTAKLEANPGNYRIGFWANKEDSVAWNYKATRPGMYDAYLTYSKASGDQTSIRVSAAGSQASGTLEPTGSWYRYRTLKLGRIYIPKSGLTEINVRCLKLDGGAVMNLKTITLEPTNEGNLTIQNVDGSVTLHASDVTIQGVKVQYERFPHKNTVGYWVNESDWAYWDFTVRRPGTFAVEILQGCGKGHGGSDVKIEVGSEELTFKVEETGHFQNFVPRYIGQITLRRPDEYQLAVKPIHKAAGAVMDLRRVRLVPVLK